MKKTLKLVKIFGVKEEQEFFVGNDKNRYCILKNELIAYDKNFDEVNSKDFLVSELNGAEIRLAEKRLTSHEATILSNLPVGYEFLARDKFGSLYAYNKLPIKDERKWNGFNAINLDAFKHLFNQVSFTDCEPKNIKELINSAKKNSTIKRSEL